MLHDGRAIRVAVVGGTRLPFCRSYSAYKHCSNQQMMTAAMAGLVDKLDLKGQTLGDVALGAVIHHSSDWNLARECVIDSGLSLRTPGVTLQRACGTSLEAAILIANKIALGQIDGLSSVVVHVVQLPVTRVSRDELPIAHAHGAIAFVLPEDRVLALPLPTMQQVDERLAFQW